MKIWIRTKQIQFECEKVHDASSSVVNFCGVLLRNRTMLASHASYFCGLLLRNWIFGENMDSYMLKTAPRSGERQQSFGGFSCILLLFLIGVANVNNHLVDFTAFCSSFLHVLVDRQMIGLSGQKSSRWGKNPSVSLTVLVIYLKVVLTDQSVKIQFSNALVAMPTNLFITS